MKKKKVIGGKKHPRVKLLRGIKERLTLLLRHVERDNGKHADNTQKKLDALMRKYLRTPKLQNVKHMENNKKQAAAERLESIRKTRAVMRARAAHYTPLAPAPLGPPQLYR